MRSDTVVSVRSNLPRFDGFPYLVTRVVEGLFHVIVLPADLPSDGYWDLFRGQCEANQLDTCLVLSHSFGWYASRGGVCTEPTEPPAGGAIVFDRLAACEAFDWTPDLLARRARLARFAAERTPSGYLVGDLTKGGRPATPAEREALPGRHAGGIPNGLERCWQCRNWRGECLDANPNLDGVVVRVHCRCENDNRCASCGGHLAERRLNANYCDERDGTIWHVPGFCGLGHRCPR